ncbi:hypothetical protein [Streptomyces sp. NPDC048644]|uniref:hypothetical protein n=1 Tax=Streptomyces sp. NPDC048644 TaxID=3365582 RepID=UPI003723C0ED
MKQYADDLVTVRIRATRAAYHGKLDARFRELNALFETCGEMATAYHYPHGVAERLVREAVETYLQTRHSRRQEAA